MMKNKVVLLAIVQMLALPVLPQDVVQIQPGQDLARKLAQKFSAEKNPIVATVSKREYEFHTTGQSERPVSAVMQATDSLIAIGDFNSFTTAEFFDSQSRIDDIALFNEQGSRLVLEPVIQRYGQQGIFLSDLNVSYLSFNMSEMGMQRKLRYKKRMDDARFLTSVFFHEHFPVAERQIVFEIPDDVGIELLEFNFAGYDIKKTSEQKMFGKTLITYTAKNLTALKSEVNAPPRSHNFPHLLVICKTYGKSSPKNVFSSNADLYKWYHDLAKNLPENADVLKPIVNSLTAGKTSDIEKIEAVYYWVQENIRYIAFEDGIMGFQPESCDSVYYNRYGDCKGKANLLKNMLKILGYDARLTWIGTNDIPYNNSIPSFAANNHMICTVLLSGKKYFLDGTEDYIALGDHAARIQGRPVMIENGDSFMTDSIPVYPKERNLLERKYTFQIDGAELTGKAEVIFNGEEKTSVLRGYASVSTSERAQALKNALCSNDKNQSAENLVSPDMNERKQPLNFKYDVQVRNHIFTIGSTMYVSPELENEFFGFLFEDERANDYEFSSSILHKTTTTIAIPKGYKIGVVPAEVNISNKDFRFSVRYVADKDQIRLEKTISIENALLSVEIFDKWNEAVEKLTQFYKTPFTLEKK